ncbi:MAG: MotA/TolQ/ExbB proton channel family protein [Victivallales bacterium]|jgi:biopolymer transport protein ExbB|nr:MotA/TolQ/ExbB proton channel family protein [Victivallales bacterium]MBT7166474.1 MotA/TolQ/ExbB proton channel family protein [Victivallales bacterium]MBT7304316.1 MotA/TolQ/ExbB proton channel family protein [Victivallales bacterium]
MSYLQSILNEGGPVMYMIFACGVLAMFITLGRLFHLHRAQIDVHEFISGLHNVLRQQSALEAVHICDETPGPVAHVVRAAVLHADQDEAAVRTAVEEAALIEVPRLERFMKLLATLAHIAPLLGLLGTVVGMIAAFDAMEAQGPLVGTKVLAEGVRKALYTTAAGLSVSIPTFAFYNYLVSRIESLVNDMQKAAAEMTYFVTHHDIALETATVIATEDAEQADDED